MSDTDQSHCPKPGHFSWNELITADPQGSKHFYGELFGWEAAPFAPPGAPAGGPPYFLLKTDANDMGAGGMMPAPAPGIPTHWLAYVVVENADTSLAKAVALGGKALTEVMSVGEIGRVAVLQDPQGAVFGIHEPPK
jgi:predicted enzyme related to lactoylglutathione lyase